VVIEGVLSAIKAALGRENRHPALATCGYLALGAIVGVLTIMVIPTRLVGTGPVRGTSIIVATLAGGSVMHAWGQYRRAHGHDPTHLATFYGGAAFMCALSAVRVLWLLEV
jgi:hypothetical protein